jgi:hypothetical protein
MKLLLIASLLLSCAPAATLATTAAKQQSGPNIPKVTCPAGSTMNQACLTGKKDALIRTVNALNQDFTNTMVDLAADTATALADCNDDKACETAVNDAYATLALQYTTAHTGRVKIAEDAFVAEVLRDCCENN